jgi:hypothetical protein
MAGPRTKFGFAGSAGEGLESRSSPTVLGHAPHLGVPVPGEVVERAPAAPPGDPVAPPSPAEPGEVSAEVAGQPPSHSGKSNYPSVARLFGRWDENGNLVIDDPPIGETTIDDADPLEVPHQRGLRPWMLVVIALAVGLAVIAFARNGRPRPAPPARVGIGSFPGDRTVAVFAMDFLADGRMP